MERVMIVTNSLTGGGAERSMNLVCNELTKRGWPVSLVPINSGLPDKVIPLCEVFPLDRPWKAGVLRTTASILRFNQLVKSWNPDIIVLNCDLPELFGVFLLGKRRVVAIEHATNPWTNRLKMGKFVRNVLALRKVTWAAVSTHLTIWPQKKKPVAVLRNPVISFSGFKADIFERSISRLVYLGRLSSEKRPSLALELALMSELELVIIGEGYLRNELESKAVNKSINAKFLGRLESPWSQVQPGDLLIVPSISEGDGLVVIEGLQMQVPMLLADIPDFRRFGFPEKNYCSELSGFAERIKEYRNNLEELKIPIEISKPLLLERDLSVIGNAWEIFLKEIV